MKRSPVPGSRDYSGRAIRAGGSELTLQARSTQLAVPGWHAGVIRDRPLSVTVRGADGHEQTLPVRDHTRIIQAVIAVGAAAAALVLLAARKAIMRR